MEVNFDEVYKGRNQGYIYTWDIFPLSESGILIPRLESLRICYKSVLITVFRAKTQDKSKDGEDFT